MADDPSTLRQGRVRRRLRHHPRDVPGRRTANAVQGARHRIERERAGLAAAAGQDQVLGRRLVSRTISASTMAMPTRLCAGTALANFSTLSATPETKTPESFPRIK